MVLAPCTVAVGLFGLLTKTRPADCDASIIESRSRRNIEAPLILLTGGPRFFATPGQFSNDGAAVTRRCLGVVKARTPFLKSSSDPPPRTMFSGLILNFD